MNVMYNVHNIFSWSTVYVRTTYLKPVDLLSDLPVHSLALHTPEHSV